MKRFAILLITIAAAGIFAYTALRAAYLVPDNGTLMPTSTPIVAEGGALLPTRLIIARIGVDAGVQKVGVNAKGNMGVPSNYTDVAWYQYGTAPGQLGSAVMDGHVDNGLSLPGVFKRLAEVRVGDTLNVRREDGSMLHFRVDEVNSYPTSEVPLERVFNRKDAARLVLITCAGDWVKEEKTYDTRLVVYASLASTTPGQASAGR